jgi:hypothetical protein
VFLVHDDHADLGHRREHRRPRAHHHVHVAAPDAMPLIVALAVGEPAVLNGDAFAERGSKERRDRRSQGDLRHHQQRLASGAAGAIGQAQIDLGLATARHAVQQRHAKLRGIGERTKLFERGLLLGRELPFSRDLHAGKRGTLERVTLVGLAAPRHQAARGQPADHVRRDPPVAKL